MFSHRSILKEAWKNTIKYKYLWLLGLFASVTAIASSWEYDLLSQNFSQNIIDGSYFQLEKMFTFLDSFYKFLIGMASLFTLDIWSALNALTIIIIFLLLISSVVWLSISSQGALVNALKKILSSKKEVEISYRENITVGHKNFWPVLTLNILTKLFIYLCFLIIGIPLLLMTVKDASFLAVFYIILFIIFVPVSTGFALMMKYAISYQIFEEGGLIKSVRQAYRLFKNNWLISLEMSVILFIISFFAGLIFSLFISITIIPVFFTGLIINSIWLSFFSLFLGIALLIAFGAILSTFQVSVWTGLFYHLKKSNNGILAKAERFAMRFIKK